MQMPYTSNTRVMTVPSGLRLALLCAVFVGLSGCAALKQFFFGSPESQARAPSISPNSLAAPPSVPVHLTRDFAPHVPMQWTHGHMIACPPDCLPPTPKTYKESAPLETDPPRRLEPVSKVTPKESSVSSRELLALAPAPALKWPMPATVPTLAVMLETDDEQSSNIEKHSTPTWNLPQPAKDGEETHEYDVTLVQSAQHWLNEADKGRRHRLVIHADLALAPGQKLSVSALRERAERTKQVLVITGVDPDRIVVQMSSGVATLAQARTSRRSF